MFPYISVGPGDLVDILLPLEPCVRHILLIFTPGDALVLQQVDNGGDVSINGTDGVIVHAKVVTAMRGDIIWLGRVSDSKIVAERDTLAGQPCQVGFKPVSQCLYLVSDQLQEREGVLTIANSHSIVGVLKPDHGETVKRLALDIADRAEGVGLGLLRNGRPGSDCQAVGDLKSHAGSLKRREALDRHHRAEESRAKPTAGCGWTARAICRTPCPAE